MGILISPSDDQNITAFSDADWASNRDDRRSIASYCIFLGNTLVSWSSKKQTAVARSSTESEYRALAHTSAGIKCLTQLLTELGVQNQSKPTIWCDNLSVGSLATNSVFYARTKHIEIDVHFVRIKFKFSKALLRFFMCHPLIKLLIVFLTRYLTPNLPICIPNSD